MKWHAHGATRHLKWHIHSEREGYTVSTPLEVARHSKWHTPLEVAYATLSGIRHSKWHTPLEVARHLRWHTPLEVARHLKWHELAKSKSTTFASSLDEKKEEEGRRAKEGVTPSLKAGDLSLPGRCGITYTCKDWCL